MALQICRPLVAGMLFENLKGQMHTFSPGLLLVPSAAWASPSTASHAQATVQKCLPS